MPKGGYKYTKQQPPKDTRNQLPKSHASSKLNRLIPKGQGKNCHLRSASTIQRLRMYKNGKEIRNKEGKIVGGLYLMNDRSGDSKITGATGRIQPDRRWFGNSRVVGQSELDKFREEMTTKQSDPYSIVLKRKKIPIGLLQCTDNHSKYQKIGLLEQEPFERVFGKKCSRKRVKLNQLMVGRTSNSPEHHNEGNNTLVKSLPIQKMEVTSLSLDNDYDAYKALLTSAMTSSKTYDAVNTRDDIALWGRDSNIQPTTGEGVDWRFSPTSDIFLKGQSKRIWGEFFKVIDCSDVILHVIDARNVPGTRCTMIERHVTSHANHKHLIFVLNKIDLIPKWAVKRWMGILSTIRPSIAFHASLTHAFGKGILISLLRQFEKLHDRKQISVGVVGYPNVGKSSVINTLISKRSCNVAPIPGETKIWQYIKLFRNLYLIDCPGVVVNSAGDTETDSVLKGVVRSERLDNPEEFVDAILRNVKREYIAAQYGVPIKGKGSWENSQDLLEKIAIKNGRLLKGGKPCRRSAAVTLINDFQRGKLPHFVPPPDLKNTKHVSVKGISEQITLSAKSKIMPKLEKIEVSHTEYNQFEPKDELVHKKITNYGIKNTIYDYENILDEDLEYVVNNETEGILIGDGDWDN